MWFMFGTENLFVIGLPWKLDLVCYICFLSICYCDNVYWFIRAMQFGRIWLLHFTCYITCVLFSTFGICMHWFSFDLASITIAIVNETKSIVKNVIKQITQIQHRISIALDSILAWKSEHFVFLLIFNNL